MKTTCRICRSLGDTKHLPIYAFGSEGVNVCFQCELDITGMVRAMASAAGRSHINGYKAAKHVAETKEAA